MIGEMIPFSAFVNNEVIPFSVDTIFHAALQRPEADREDRTSRKDSRIMPKLLKSNVCNQAQLESEIFQRWCDKTGEPRNHMHRKVWEFCYIAQALYERGMLAPGRRGLGFGVGKEPLVALFASYGCEIIATDLDAERAHQAGWVESNQHAANLEALNERRICDPELFDRNVSFRNVDMTDIPKDLRGFDFTWSACSLEHLGSIERGKRFIYDTMDCLKPGGIAIHTTEYNVSSNVNTIDNHDFMVLFRKRDIKDMAHRLTRDNHRIDLDFTLGAGIADDFIDIPPFKHNPHLKLVFPMPINYVTTSIGLIIGKDRAGIAARTMQRSRSWLAYWLSATAGLRKGA